MYAIRSYYVGDRKEEYVITVHDLHTTFPVAWNQSMIRNPFEGKKPALPQGYWMIDIEKIGKYEIELRRWPKESGLKFNDTTPQLGVESGWYDAMPEGIVLNIKNAQLNIDALHLEKAVDMKKEQVTFTANLHEGRQHLDASFTDDKGNDFSAFYVYIRKLD